MPFLLAESNIINNHLLIYPNPSSNFIKLNTSDLNAVSVEIFDLKGKQVLFAPNYISKTIDISFLKAGTYVIVLNDQTIRKIIKE